MTSNDIVVLRFTHPDERTRHDAPWAHVHAVVSALQNVVEHAVGTTFTPVKRPAFRVTLLAHPRAGSLELVLQFELVELVQANTPSSKTLLAIAQSGIDTVADLAGIAGFIMALLLARHGVLAQTTRQDEPPPDTKLDAFLAKEAKRLSMSMAKEVRALVNAAYESNMEVDVAFRDFGWIRINPTTYKRNGRFIGRGIERQVETPGDTFDVTIANEHGPVVGYKGQRYRAVIGRMGSGRTIVLLAFDNRPLPKGAVTVRGAIVPDVMNIEVEVDLPDEFADALGPFLVANFAVWQR